ncbi:MULTISPECIES: hypothetical protein [unclassified Streptomyces]|uniref:hypothetical protein n=1 Tax=unclassified Streptomyces TaxID=2593676 RepID=UPI003BB77B17
MWIQTPNGDLFNVAQVQRLHIEVSGGTQWYVLGYIGQSSYQLSPLYTTAAEAATARVSIAAGLQPPSPS